MYDILSVSVNPALEKFNQVEAALKNLLESIPELEGRVDIGIYSPRSQYPRAIIRAERLEMDEINLSGGVLEHNWHFIIVIEHVAGAADEGYAKMKKLIWDVYNAIMRNRTLGVGVHATPVEALLEHRSEEKKFMFSWTFELVVTVYI